VMRAPFCDTFPRIFSAGPGWSTPIQEAWRTAGRPEAPLPSAQHRFGPALPGPERSRLALW